MLLEYRTDRRGYTMWLELDLFGSFVLYRRWYGLYNRRGGMKRQVFEREEDALKTMLKIIRLRQKHGYALVRYQQSGPR